jgi:hypothetical protein
LQKRRQLDTDLHIRVTGPLRKMSNRWSLFVRTTDDQPIMRDEAHRKP